MVGRPGIAAGAVIAALDVAMSAVSTPQSPLASSGVGGLTERLLLAARLGWDALTAATLLRHDTGVRRGRQSAWR